MTDRTTTHIAGTNRGTGPEIARRLIAAGHTDRFVARYAGRGQAAVDIIRAHLVRLDVTDDASIDAAAEVIRRLEGRDDILVDDTGIGTLDATSASATAAVIRRFFETKVFGTVRVYEGLSPLAGTGSPGDRQHEEPTGLARQGGRPGRTGTPVQPNRGQPAGGRRFDADHSVRQSIPQGPAQHG